MDSPGTFNPFPGLRSFEPDEDHLFFGRDTQVDDLLGRLRRTRFLAVVGGSGSGKSSLVKSGLIPSLHGGYMAAAGSSWRVAMCRPGGDPIQNLAVALNDPGVLGRDTATADLNRMFLDTALRRSGLGLVSAVREARISEGENVLVVVDQFEELFRFKRIRADSGGRDEAVSFVKLLLEAASQTEIPIYVALTMRSEFIGNCAEFPGLAETVNEGQYLVPRMTRDEVRVAITGPVAVGGGTIAPRLVTRVLNEVGDDADQLPVLQHALMRTWDHSAGLPDSGQAIDLDLADYQAIGTMRHALSRHADEAYDELANDKDKHIAMTAFKALTETTGEGLGLRRPCTMQELCDISEAPIDVVASVVDRFRAPGRSFVVPPTSTPLEPATIVDLSHESLMRLWTRLVAWKREEGRSAEIYRRVLKAAALHERGEAGLWRDPELQLALNWRAGADPTPAWARRYSRVSGRGRSSHRRHAEKADVAGTGTDADGPTAPNDDFERVSGFLAASEQARADSVAAAEAEAAAKEQERRRQVRLAKRVTLVMAVLSLLAVGGAVWAAQKTGQARRAQEEADDAQFKATIANAHVASEVKRAAAANREAYDANLAAEGATRTADRAILAANSANLAAQIYLDSATNSLAQAESAKAAAEASRMQAERDSLAASVSRADATAAQAEADTLAALALSRVLAAKSLGQWGEASREVPALLAVQAFNISTRYQRDPARDPTIYAGLRAGLRALASERGKRDSVPDLVVRGQTDAARSLALHVSPAGEAAATTRLAVGGDDGQVLLFEVSDGGSVGPPVTLPGGPAAGPILSLAFDAAGRWLAGGTLDGKIRLWNRRDGSQEPAVIQFGGAVTALSFHGRGGLVAGGYADSVGMVGVWDEATLIDLAARRTSPARGGTARTLLRDSARVLDVAISPVANLVAVALSDGRVRFIGLDDAAADPASRPREKALANAVTAVAFTGSGRTVLAGQSDGHLSVLRLTDDAIMETGQRVHRARITGLTIGRDLVASSSLDGSVLFWPFDPANDFIEVRAEPLELPGHREGPQTSWVWDALLSPDGSVVYSASADRTVRIQHTRVAWLVGEICKRLGPRELTLEEWRDHVSSDTPQAPTCTPEGNGG